MNNEEFLSAWDRGDEVTTVEMGGISPSYEMAIQLTGMEWLRLLNEEKPNLKSIDDGEMKRLEEIVHERIKHLGLQEKYGLSGAQWGAAANIGSVFYMNGYEKGLEMAGVGRHIKLKKVPFTAEPTP